MQQFTTTLDDYVYTSDDTVVEGEVEAGRRYAETDFNRIIEIREREAHRVKLFLESCDPGEKTLVFCATQAHALLVRDLINQAAPNPAPNYCVRVTADDGELGDHHLRDFQDNEKTLPTILTTSQKLSTGVDARNIRNIVLMRPIRSMIEFKQIIGRGTRLYKGKDHFTVLDFVKAHRLFSDPGWDGEPIEPEPPATGAGAARPPATPTTPEVEPDPPRRMAAIRLADGKARRIRHMMATTFWHPDGTPISAQQFLEELFGRLPEFFNSEAELRVLWGAPDTRAKLLHGLAEKGFSAAQLGEMQRLIEAENCDLFDVLAYVAYALAPVSRAERAGQARAVIRTHFNDRQQMFLDFVLGEYVRQGVEELAEDKLEALLRLKYRNAIADAVVDLGAPEEIGRLFSGFQRYLYAQGTRAAAGGADASI